MATGTFQTVASSQFEHQSQYLPSIGNRQYSNHEVEYGSNLSHDIEAIYSAAETCYRNFVHEKAALCKEPGRATSISMEGLRKDGGPVLEEPAQGHQDLRVGSSNGTGELGAKLDGMQHCMETFLKSVEELYVLSARHTGYSCRAEIDVPPTGQEIHQVGEHFETEVNQGSNLELSNMELNDMGLNNMELNNLSSNTGPAFQTEEALPDGVGLLNPWSELHDIEVPMEETDYPENTSLSTNSTKPSGESEESEPLLLTKLHNNMGKLSIQQERLSDLCLDHEEEFVARNFRLDQGQDVQPPDKVFKRRFRKRRLQIMDRIETLMIRINDLEKRCIQAGLPLPQREKTPDSIAADEEDEAVPTAEAAEQPDLGQAPNSRPPSPGASHRVTGWMKNLAI